MKRALRLMAGIAVIPVFIVLFSSFDAGGGKGRKGALSFPYRQAGLTQAQAAAHLLSRFSYGATPGQVDEVVKTGLENWFLQQLEARQADDSVQQLLSSYDALTLSNQEIVNTYPRNGQIVRMAVKDGFMNKDSVNKSDKALYKQQIEAYMQQKGYKPEQELVRQFINQKVIRAVYSNNQLQEVMTEFWLNHFNVSFTKADCMQFIPAYERDAIRPNALGNFDKLLLATAQSPAMLLYLDNFTSTGTNQYGDNLNLNKKLNKLKQNAPAARKANGLNENYAREVMELHTLGVDGGYTQSDVTQAARVLTGWTIYPMNDYYNGAVKKMLERANPDQLAQRGFVHQGDFLFTPNRHDDSDKVVLGKHFRAGGGYEEGVALLSMLAHHPSTAKFISKKLAVKFVSDNPPQSLIDKMVKTFQDKDGDIKQVLITMVNAPEFWSSKTALREKTKSPFELVVSAVRSLHAQVYQPYQLFQWANRMGQKIYYYQAPTGFPDKGQYWINTGALLNRMNFGLALANGRIPGVRFDLLALNNHHEPESAEAALTTFCKLLMPERNSEETIRRLTPLLNDPNLQQKVDKAANKTAMNQQMMKGEETADNNMQPGYKAATVKNSQPMAVQDNKYLLAQVAGIIIGSPEFQRR